MRHRFTVILIILSLLSATAAQAAGHCLMMSAGMTDGMPGAMMPAADATSDITEAADMSEYNACHEMMKQANSEAEVLNTLSADTTAMDCCGINMTDCQCVQGCSVVMLFLELPTPVADDPFHSAVSDRHTSIWVAPTLAGLYRPPISAA